MFLQYVWNNFFLKDSIWDFLLVTYYRYAPDKIYATTCQNVLSESLSLFFSKQQNQLSASTWFRFKKFNQILSSAGTWSTWPACLRRHPIKFNSCFNTPRKQFQIVVKILSKRVYQYQHCSWMWFHIISSLLTIYSSRT